MSTRPTSSPETDPDILRWPRLTRFYGLSISELMSTPRGVLNLYEEQMIELEAEEQLVAMQVADHPHVTQQGRDQTRRNLMRIAGLNIAPTIDPTATRDVSALGGIGIKVVREDA